MLILYSTIPGYFSWRNQILGSFLIQSLCKIISDHACDMDLEEMLKKVNADLQEKVARGNYKEYKQGCEYVNRGFNKKLYFNYTRFAQDNSERKQ